jgi:glycerol-3-phosphate dehydrogenase (NAD(P)+)
VGYGLARGKPLSQILQELNSTAEGVNTTQVLIQIADREEIPVPISREVYRLLNCQITAQEAVEALMERDLKPESWQL